MTTDTSERGLERLICGALTGHPCDPPQPGVVAERTVPYGLPAGAEEPVPGYRCLFR